MKKKCYMYLRENDYLSLNVPEDEFKLELLEKISNAYKKEIKAYKRILPFDYTVLVFIELTDNEIVYCRENLLLNVGVVSEGKDLYIPVRMINVCTEGYISLKDLSNLSEVERKIIFKYINAYKKTSFYKNKTSGGRFTYMYFTEEEFNYIKNSNRPEFKVLKNELK